MTTPERYTAEQMLRMAECVEDFYIPLGARLKNQHDTLYAMLRQAASDVRDTERYRFLKAHGILSGPDPDDWIDTNIGIREAIDAAMGEQEK